MQGEALHPGIMKICEVAFPVLKFAGFVLYCIFVILPSVLRFPGRAAKRKTEANLKK